MCARYAFNPEQHKVKSGLKLVLVGKQQRVAGLHIIGPCADEIVQGFAVAVRMGATLQVTSTTTSLHSNPSHNPHHQPNLPPLRTLRPPSQSTPQSAKNLSPSAAGFSAQTASRVSLCRRRRQSVWSETAAGRGMRVCAVLGCVGYARRCRFAVLLNL